MATIPSNFNFPTKNQVPDHSIMDHYNKQVYLGNQFISGGDTATLANTTETPLVVIANAATNLKSLFIDKLNLGIVGATDAVKFRIYSNPTGVSSGSANTPQNCRTASGTASIATVTVAPTVSGNGTRMQTVAVAVGGPVPQVPMIIVDPGQSILITGQAVVSATAVCEIVHYEL